MNKKVATLLIGVTAAVVFVVLVRLRHEEETTPDRYSTVEVTISDKGHSWADYNIVLISVDTLRADHMGCYGYGRNTTPNIDRLAKESLLFENAYSQAPDTMPALRAIMTGRVISNENREDIISYYHNATFLAEILGKKGYLTAGFTDHRGLGNKNEDEHMLVKGFESFQNFGTSRSEVTSHKLTEKVINWLEQSYKKKFFLWIHYFDPHFNYNPLSEYEGLFGFSQGDCGRVCNGVDIKKIREIEESLTKEEIESLVSLHQAEIFYTDEHIGKILDSVKELNLEGDTVIILTADHGEEFKERTRIGHRLTVYNELIHVPLVIKIPKQKPNRIKVSIGTKEIFNILSNLILNKDVEFDDEDIISRTYLYFKGGETKPNYFTIVSGNYKYICNPTTGKEEFYDLKVDPGEKRNLAKKFRDRKQKRRLKHKLLSWIDKNNVKVNEPSKEALKSEEELNKRLRSLGYVR
jgi:arylsulfatase A-like enzyme